MLLRQPHLRRWTKAEYHQAAELGWFNGQRVELIDGEVLQMAPQNEPHAMAILLADRALRSVFITGYVIRTQMPLAAASSSEPEPDLAVVKGTIRGMTPHPSTAVLIVEVAEATLRFDRTEKACLCASCGVQDYWIINLLDRQLEVRRSPVADSRKPFGHDYADLSIFRPGDSIAPLAKPRSKIRIADLLP